jgi:ribosomal protein S27E
VWGAGGDGRHLKHVYSTAFAVVLCTTCGTVVKYVRGVALDW